MNIPNWALAIFGVAGMVFILSGPSLPLRNLVFFLIGVSVLIGLIFGGLATLRKMLGFYRAGSETISEALERAGRDGRPRTFILRDGSRYSGRIHLGLSAELRGGATDVKPADVVKVEYPEG